MDDPKVNLHLVTRRRFLRGAMGLLGALTTVPFIEAEAAGNNILVPAPLLGEGEGDAKAAGDLDYSPMEVHVVKPDGDVALKLADDGHAYQDAMLSKLMLDKGYVLHWFNYRKTYRVAYRYISAPASSSLNYIEADSFFDLMAFVEQKLPPMLARSPEDIEKALRDRWGDWFYGFLNRNAENLPDAKDVSYRVGHDNFPGSTFSPFNVLVSLSPLTPRQQLFYASRTTGSSMLNALMNDAYERYGPF